MERPEPFIVTDSQGLLTVEPGMKKRLDESQDQLVVVAVVGAYRTVESTYEQTRWVPSGRNRAVKDEGNLGVDIQAPKVSRTSSTPARH